MAVKERKQKSEQFRDILQVIIKLLSSLFSHYTAKCEQIYKLIDPILTRMLRALCSTKKWKLCYSKQKQTLKKHNGQYWVLK